MAENLEANNSTIKILERSHVSPPPGSVPQIELPLTIFDVPYLMCGPVQRLLFYHLPHPTHHFTTTVLPNLKHSLSLTLRHFFPFTATLVLPPPPQVCPHLLYRDGASVSLTIAESSVHFNRLISNIARDVKELHPFVPKLSLPSGDGHNNIVAPVLALQITVFPNSGICIGYAFNHCMGDGRTISRFMKSWASICRTPTTSFLDTVVECAPSYNRDMINGVVNLQGSPVESFYSLAWNYWRNGHSDLTQVLEGKVRATFVLDRTHVSKLKSWVSDQFSTNEEAHALHASTFVVTCAFAWVHLTKLQTIGLQVDDKICNFLFPADCRDRNVFPYPVPGAYFGNCLVVCIAAAKTSELVGENGLSAAAKAIAIRIKELGGGATPGGIFEKTMSNWAKSQNMEDSYRVVGSPNLRSYEIDFGWGRPKKSEIVYIENLKCISLAESRDGEGGIEIGVALHKDKMERFVALFEQGLKVVTN